KSRPPSIQVSHASTNSPLSSPSPPIALLLFPPTIPRPPPPTLFPYTTLFRSRVVDVVVVPGSGRPPVDGGAPPEPLEQCGIELAVIALGIVGGDKALVAEVDRDAVPVHLVTRERGSGRHADGAPGEGEGRLAARGDALGEVRGHGARRRGGHGGGVGVDMVTWGGHRMLLVLLFPRV